MPLRALVTDSIAEVVAAGGGRGSSTRGSTTTCGVRADPARLRQLLVNVVDNAARHAPTGSRVRVTSGRTPTGWSLTVADGGPGVAPHDRERVFQRFGTDAPGEGPASGSPWPGGWRSSTAAPCGSPTRPPASPAPCSALSSPDQHPPPTRPQEAIVAPTPTPTPTPTAAVPAEPSLAAGAPGTRHGRPVRCLLARAARPGRPARRGGECAGRGPGRCHDDLHRARAVVGAGADGRRRGGVRDGLAPPQRQLHHRAARALACAAGAAADAARRRGDRAAGSLRRCRGCPHSSASPMPALRQDSCSPASRGRCRRCAVCRGSAAHCESSAPVVGLPPSCAPSWCR